MTEERKIELLEELVKWVKVTSIPKVKELLEKMLTTSKEKIAYTYSDGERTIREVSKLSRRDIGTISRDWKRWERAGIAVSVAAKRGDRAKSLFALEDFGIAVPNMRVTKKGKPGSSESSKSESADSTQSSEGSHA